MYGLMPFSTMWQLLVTVKKIMKTLISSGTERSSTWSEKTSFVSTPSTGQSFLWCWISNCQNDWLPMVGLSWKTARCLSLKGMSSTQKCWWSASAWIHFVTTSCVVCQLVLMVLSHQKTTWPASTMNWPMTLETSSTGRSPWSINTLVVKFLLMSKMLPHLMQIWLRWLKKTSLNTTSKWMRLITHVLWKPYGTSSLGLTSTSMRLLLGSSLKKMVTRNNWQRSWLT